MAEYYLKRAREETYFIYSRLIPRIRKLIERKRRLTLCGRQTSLLGVLAGRSTFPEQ